MSVKYHISSTTQRPNICRAKSPESCPLKSDDGTPPPHFDSKETARAYVEKSNEEKYGDVPATASSRNELADSIRESAQELNKFVEDLHEVNEDLRRLNERQKKNIEEMRRIRLEKEKANSAKSSSKLRLDIKRLQEKGYKVPVEKGARFVKPGAILSFPEDAKYHGKEILRVETVKPSIRRNSRSYTDLSFDDGDFVRAPSTQKLVVMERKNQDSFDEASAADHVSEMRKQKELEKEEIRKKARERRKKNADSRRTKTSENSSSSSNGNSAPRKSEEDLDYSPYSSRPASLDSDEYRGRLDRFMYSSSRDELERFGTREAIDLMKSEYSTFDSIQKVSDRASENLYKQGKTEEADRVVVQGAIHKRGKNKNYKLDEREKTAVIRNNSPYNKALVSEIEKTDPALVKRIRAEK